MTPEERQAIRERDAQCNPDSIDRKDVLYAFLRDAVEDRRALLAEVEALRKERDAAVTAEREECAKLCDEKEDRARSEYAGWHEKEAYLDGRASCAEELAELIRARAFLAALEKTT